MSTHTITGEKIVPIKASGPSSYATGGFKIKAAGLTRIDAVSLSVLKAPDTAKIVYKIDVTYSGNEITVVVKQIDVTSTTAAWAEVAAGTDLSGLVIEGFAIGA